MSSQKQQSHIPYYFRSQLRPVRRPVFISQLGSGHETPHRNQQNLEIAGTSVGRIDPFLNLEEHLDRSFP